MIKTKTKMIATPDQVVEMTEGQPPLSRELRGLTVPLVEQEVDLAALMEDQGTTALVAEDSQTVQQVVDRAKANEAAESIDILKDRQFQ